jgi:hypothetical protein
MAIASDPIALMLEHLASYDDAIQQMGEDELEALRQSGVDASVARRLLDAAVHFKSRPLDTLFEFTACHLIEAASASIEHCLPTVEQNFPLYGSEAQGRALAVLAESDSVAALELFWKLAEPQFANSDFRLYPRTTYALAEREEASCLPFLAKLDEDLPDGSLSAIVSIIWGHVTNGWVSTEALGDHSKALVAVCRKALAELSRKQQETGVAWMWADDYIDLRIDVDTWLELLIHVQTPSVAELFAAAGRMTDPLLKYHALAYQLKAGNPPELGLIDDVAKSAEMRRKLAGALYEAGHFELLDEKWRTQEAFAESDMVCWLTHPSELCAVPDQIEPLGKLPFLTDDVVEGLLYVYRFRVDEPHWAAKDGWMVGWAGPYPVTGPLEYAGGYTFSKFETWDPRAALEDQVDVEELRKLRDGTT